MPRDIESFKQIVDRRSKFYESIELETLAVEKESTWYNLHTDVHLRPEKPDEISVSKSDIIGPAAYFHDVVSIDELWNLFERMFGEEYSGYDESVVFPGLSLTEGEDHWKENIYRGDLSDYNRADGATGIRIQSNIDDPLPNKSQFEERLRQLDPPYYDVNDLCREYLGHTSPKWSKPRTQFFAPLYIQITEQEITESGNFILRIQAHESIQDPVVSTWARKDREIIDRERHTLTEAQTLDGPFHEFKIEWEINGHPTDVSTSIFHSMFEQIREITRLSSSVPLIALETVLDKTDSELSSDFNQILVTPNEQPMDNVEFADDFEATVITMFNLAGFTTFSPDWYDYLSNKGSLPDLIAYSKEYSVLLVGECTLAVTDDKIKTKIHDALASTHEIEERFDEIDLLDPDIIPLCITPAESVSPVVVPDEIQLLTGPKLQELRREAQRSSDPENILREWETYNHRQKLI